MRAVNYLSHVLLQHSSAGKGKWTEKKNSVKQHSIDLLSDGARGREKLQRCMDDILFVDFIEIVEY